MAIEKSQSCLFRKEKKNDTILYVIELSKSIHDVEFSTTLIATMCVCMLIVMCSNGYNYCT